jgi:DNA-directed RNA polymerase subunit RPC12/RpoP
LGHIKLMPEYVYTCVCKNEITVAEPREIDQKDRPNCPRCGLKMWRKPQPVNVNWNGLKPSDGDLPPAVKSHVDNVAEIREKVDEFYDQRKGWINTEEVHNSESI